MLAHPGDFWANVELAYLSYVRNPVEGLGYYRTALAIRPETPEVHGGIGVLYLRYDQMPEARHHFQEAADRAPSEPWPLNNLGMIALAEGHREEAATHLRAALHLDPEYASAHCNLALVLESDGRRAEALEECRKALRLDPKGFAVKPDLQGLWLRLNFGDEWRCAWQQELAAEPPDHDAWFGYAELCVFLRQEAEYRRIRRIMLRVFETTTNSYVAMRIGRACLLLPESDDESRQAVALIDRGVAAKASRSTWIFHHFLFSKAMAEYRLGRFDAAIALLEGEAASASSCTRLLVAMAQHRSGQTDRACKTLAAAVLAFDCSPAKADNIDGWYFHIFRREAEALILPQRPAFLEGRYQPRDNDERLALAGGCRFRDLRRAEASLYAAAFAADPTLAERLATGLRYRAARAAAVAGCGGADGAGLSEQEACAMAATSAVVAPGRCGRLGERARDQSGGGSRQGGAHLASWRADPDLAGLRDPRALDALPEAERRECLAIWGDLTARVGRSSRTAARTCRCSSRRSPRPSPPAACSIPRNRRTIG